MPALPEIYGQPFLGRFPIGELQAHPIGMDAVVDAAWRERTGP
jgi:hypothetical protein